MAFSGTTFSRLWNFLTERVNNEKMFLARLDEDLDGIADGLTTLAEADVTVTDGTFTPTLTAETPGDLSVTYTIQSGRYTRVDSVVLFEIYLECVPTFTTAAREIIIAGLPVTAEAGTSGQGYAIAASDLTGLITPSTSYEQALLYVVQGGTTVQGRWLLGNSSMGDIEITHATSGNTLRISCAGHYPV